VSKLEAIDALDVLALRKELGLKQVPFWSAIGVTQSGGSRYENDRRMPSPVAELVRLAYIEQIDIKAIKSEDWEVIKYLKSQEPELFKSLSESARVRNKKAA
jgi:hypothetical protein